MRDSQRLELFLPIIAPPHLNDIEPIKFPKFVLVKMSVETLVEALAKGLVSFLSVSKAQTLIKI